MSDSGDVSIKIELFGIGNVKGVINRHSAAFCADAVLRKMPFTLRGRFNFNVKNYWSLPGVGIHKGLNPKSEKKGKKGDILYNPKSDELLILLEDFEMPYKVSKIGIILKSENLDLFLKAKNGLNTKFSKIR
ncbi:MAG: cyclophilin-like fold protein [Promethearchaeota archaeon]